MAYNNFTVSDFNFNETQGDDLSANGTIRLTITPDDGYIVLASDFSLTTPFPAGIDPSSVSFQQSGSLVFLDINFLAGTIMPSNDIEVPLCLSGFAKFAPYSVEGLVNLGTQNATPAAQQYAYSQTGDFTQTKLVWNQTIQANPGFYFYQAPIAAINNGDPSAYNIIATETLNQYNELVAITYDINYTFPASSVTGDIINIQAIAIPSVGNTTYINAFNVSGIGNLRQPSIPNSGDTRVLNLFGDPGATFSASLFYQDGAGTEIVIATNEVMPSNGQYSSSDIIFPPSADGESPYKIIIEGDLNPTLPLDEGNLVISFAQTSSVTFTVQATPADNTNIETSSWELIAIPNYTYGPGEPNTLDFTFKVTSLVNFLTITDTVDADSFDPAIPDPNYPATEYSIGNIIQGLGPLTPWGNSKEYEVSGTITIQTTQDDSILHTLDLNDIIVASEVPFLYTRNASDIFEGTATSGGYNINSYGYDVTEKGVEWSDTFGFDVVRGFTENGSGTDDFISSLTGLYENTTIYSRAYAVSEKGTGYGNVHSFESGYSGGIEVRLANYECGYGGNPAVCDNGSYPNVAQACNDVAAWEDIVLYTGAGLTAPECGMELYTDDTLLIPFDGLNNAGNNGIYKIRSYNGNTLNYAVYISGDGVLECDPDAGESITNCASDVF